MIKRLFEWLDWDTSPTVRFVEAAGVSIGPDADEDQWRRLTGDSQRDLSPMTHKRMQDIGAYLWRSNPVANRLIELPTAYLLADGVSIVSTAEDPDMRAIVDDWIVRFWRHPINNFPIKLPKKARELAVFGEQCWPAFVNPFDGEVRLGYLDPGLIETVVVDPDNAEQPIGVVTKRNQKGIQRRYRVIVNGPEDYLFTQRTAAIRQTFTDGECFYFAVNNLCSDSRGCSDIFHVADWCDAYEKMLDGEMQRQDFLRAFVWDVTLKGGSLTDVKTKSRELSPPGPGTIRVHNDSEVWAALTPDIKAADGAEGARLFRNHVLGGLTMPEHWFGGGGDVNRSTGESMSEPTLKTLSMRQSYLGFMLEEAVRYQIRQREIATTRREPDIFDPIYGIAVQWPEMSPQDTSKYAAAFAQAANGCAMAMDRGLLSKAGALAVLDAISARLGVKFDIEAELAKAETDTQKAAEADAYPGPVL